MDLNLGHYNTPPLLRTLEELSKMARIKGKQEKYSCEHEPLLNIELDHAVLDKLHLLIHIMDILMQSGYRGSRVGQKRKFEQTNS